MKARYCFIATLLSFGLTGAASGAAEFSTAKPTQRVEYWQHREVEVNASVSDVRKLSGVKLLFVGDSITDFWLLNDIPWAKGQQCGRKIWEETFNEPGSENFGLDLGISGDRTEHLLYRLLPRSQGGAGIIDAPELRPEFIILMIGINNISPFEEPAVDSMFEGIRAVVVALHERKPMSRIILQSLLPIGDEVKNGDVVRPVNRRLATLADSQPFARFVSFLDLYPAFVDSSGKQIARYFNDGTHPSEEGYRVWRDQLVPFLSKIRSTSSRDATHEPARPDVAADRSTAEPVGIDPLFTAPPASLSAAEIAALQARLADFAQLDHFRADDERLSRTEAAAPRIVLIGDSITDNWNSDAATTFSPGKEYINRGISGQTTAQMLLRFRQDVINLHPAVVLILGGTNDIAGNTGVATLPMIEDNLRSMTELAKSNHIRVILASLLPASDYPWRPGLRPAARVRELNAWIKRYAHSAGAIYLDFYSALANAQGGMDAALASDGVHPTAAGYAIMTPLAQRAIDQALAR